MDIKKIVAVMAVRENDPEKVGSYEVKGDSSDGLAIGPIEEREVEFCSPEDFEEPKRENFEDFINQIQDPKAHEDNVTIHYLMEAPE